MIKNVRSNGSMLKMSYASCPGLSSAISAQFTVEVCVAAENCKKYRVAQKKRFEHLQALFTRAVEMYQCKSMYVMTNRLRICVGIFA